ncbi:MAG: heme ABC transporter permease [Gammaproteobacteria bacterium]|nr:MAG: heme ABC transporter permease [Gammaproteobacteria bacterium]
MFKFLHKFGSPPYFYNFINKILPYLYIIFFGLLLYGMYGALITAPADYQQGNSFRIIYVHVPAAWMSMFVYMVMASCAVVVLIWRMKMAQIMLISSVAVGAIFTTIALVTGSIWGKPMWGAWWVWDARLTSELILLFLYIGVLALYNAIEDKKIAIKAVSILVLVGVVNIPIIHYSVEWWNTLHQGPTVTKFDKPSIHIDMLIPLLVMAVAFKFYYIINLLHNAKNQILISESTTSWVKDMVKKQS